ncbi:hypothetical protein ACP4OV_010527 [Aristida adscensionis]
MTDERGGFRNNKLLDQIATATDQSDYLWYITRGQNHSSNGNSLGRYWPSYTAAEMAGCHVCDYRGTYKAEGDGLRCLVTASAASPAAASSRIATTTCPAPSSALASPTRLCSSRRPAATPPPLCSAPSPPSASPGPRWATTSRSRHRRRVASYGVTRGGCGAYERGCESKAAFSAACVGKVSCTVRHTAASAGAGCESGKLTVQVACW